ncbi:MAG: type I-E CRISPR-associated protein Cse1/CasA [Candidatus Binatia bacterium]
MPDMRHNLLTEPVFSVQWPEGKEARITLPEVLAHLGNGAPIEFAALQAHQMHAWHAFLVQLAAIALHHAGEGTTTRNAESWRGLLRTLTEDRDEPWCLVVDDLSQPAFMQPPVPEGSLAKWNAIACPDEMDLLVTAKNHDLKTQRIGSARPEHWAYALISLQTMEGFGGSKNYGIARMNGGYGNRPCIAVSSDARWATRFVRDVQLLLAERSAILSRYGYQPIGGHALLWLVSWDGESSLHLTRCDPFFVEVCRRVRLVPDGTAVVARTTGSAAQRLTAKDRKGDLGDLWTPIRRTDGAAFGYKDVSYETMQEVLFGSDWTPSPASQPQPEDGDAPLLIAQVLGRGQGRTEGLHERLIPVPPKARRLFGTPDGRERLGKLSKQRVELVATVRAKVLFPALKQLTETPSPFTRALDEHVDTIFFERLFDDVDREPGEASRDFTRRVLHIAREILCEAIESVPLPAVRRYRAISAAEGIFEGTARKRFPDVHNVKGEDTDDRAVCP